MAKLSKFILIIFVATFAFNANAVALPGPGGGSDNTDATVDASKTSDNASNEVQAEDLDVKEPNLLPGNPFYFLKEWGRGIQSFFALGRLKKTELEQRFANERLIELKKLAEEGKVSADILEKATEKYNRTIEKIKKRTDKIRENAEQDENVNKFLEKFTNQQVLHERILQKLEEKVPENVLEKIKEARERHLERFQEVMQKLENNKERIAEKIENALKEADETNAEILERIREKMPDDIKGELNQVRERIREKINSPDYLRSNSRYTKDITISKGDNGLKGKILRGPVCPVVQESSEKDCEDKPYAGATITVKSEDRSNRIGSTTSDNSGEFSIALNPGTYYIEVITGSKSLECPAKETTIEPGEFTEIKITCDTGIR